MKKLTLIFLVQFSLSAFSSDNLIKESIIESGEDIVITVSQSNDSCIQYKKDILNSIKNFAQNNKLDGRYIVATANCDIETIIQDSNYEFVSQFEKIRMNFSKKKVENDVANHLKQVQSREGYLWSTVDRDNFGFLKGRIIRSLYLRLKK